MNKNSIKKTEKPIVQQDKNQKHRRYVLDQWLKTQQTYKEDLQGALNIIKKRIKQKQLISSQQRLNNLFPDFQQMKMLSILMMNILKDQKNVNTNKVLIGSQLNKIVDGYKVYLQYFRKKSQMKKIYDQIEKQNPNKLKDIQKQLRQYFRNQFYKNNPQNKMNPKQNITIIDCLERPLYRLFKYHLLIDNYLKKLPQINPDYSQLKNTRASFIAIGQKCNNYFTQQQKQELKNKLEKLYGRSLPQASYYKSTMTAETLNFPSKLYIFNNLVIISIVDKMIGFRQEKLYMNMGIDQFSFIAYRKDVKYFKNILVLCGIYQCIHLFLPDKGTRLQIYNLINAIVYQQKNKSFQRRQHKQVQTNKISFLQDQNRKSIIYLTGLQFQVLDIDMRQITFLNSDTAFIINIFMPEYIDDQATYLKNSFKDDKKQISKGNQRLTLTNQQAVIASKVNTIAYKKSDNQAEFGKKSHYSTINQRIQIQLIKIIELHKMLKSDFPQVKLPQIDPLSKDFNIYTQSKKKTKSFEVRAILIQQFLNFIFRHPTLMSNPLSTLKTLGIYQQIWQYVHQRSQYLKKQTKDTDLNQDQTQGNLYDHNHCKLCKKSQIQRIQQFQMFRKMKVIKRQFTSKDNYCLNFFNLLRNNFLSLPYQSFNNLQRILLYSHYYQGRLDYCFLYKKFYSKVTKSIRVLVPHLVNMSRKQVQQINNNFYSTCYPSVDHKTTVGMIMNELQKQLQIFNIFDFRIVLEFNKQERILDQDQLIQRIIQKYKLEFTEEKNQTQSHIKSIYRNSNDTSTLIMDKQKQQTGMFDFVKNWFPDKNKDKPTLYLRKIIYLPFHIELDSFNQNPQRIKMVIAQIFYKISLSERQLQNQIWQQICALYFIFKNYKSPQLKQKFKKKQSIQCECKQILLNQNFLMFKSENFIDKIIQKIQQNSKINQKASLNELFLEISQKILEISYLKFNVNNYYVEVCAKKIPQKLLINKQNISGNCYIGVNYKQIVIVQNLKQKQPSIILPLQDVQICHSVYSIFINYKKQNQLEESNRLIEQIQLRFDCKMLYGFTQLCQKYKILKQKFAQLYKFK